MDFFLNERFFPPGRTLKCLLVEPVPAPGPRTLGATFLLTGGTQGAQPVERQPKGLDAVLAAGQGSQLLFSAAEWTVTGRSAASNSVVALIGRTPVSRRDFVVLAPGDYQNLLKSTQSEKIGRQQFFTSPEEVLRSWNQSWHDLFAYLGVQRPPHITRRGKSLTLAEAELSSLSTDAFAFANFHINRFLFNQVFYGGEIQFERSDRRDAVEFVATIKSSGPAIDPERAAIDELQSLVASLAIDGYRVSIDWQPSEKEARLLAAWAKR